MSTYTLFLNVLVKLINTGCICMRSFCMANRYPDSYLHFLNVIGYEMIKTNVILLRKSLFNTVKKILLVSLKILVN